MTPRRRSRRRSQAGFTMIEVIIAVLLTAIATSGIIGLYMVETRASGFSRHTTEATVLAEDEMEFLRTSKLTVGTATVTGLNEHGLAVPGGLFTRIYTVTQGAAPAQPYDDLVVQVQWIEDGVSRQITLRGRRNQ